MGLNRPLGIVPLDINTFNRRHSVQEVLDQEAFLDLGRKRAQRLRFVLHFLRLSLLKEPSGKRVMPQMWPFKQPVRQMRHRSFLHFKHTGRSDLESLRRDQVLLSLFNLQEVAEWRFKADIVKLCHAVFRCDPSSVQDSPFGQLGNRILALLVPLVPFDP